jgi:hypothetical protein
MPSSVTSHAQDCIVKALATIDAFEVLPRCADLYERTGREIER